MIEEGRGRLPSAAAAVVGGGSGRAVLENGATILELESAVAAGGGWPRGAVAGVGEDKPTMKGKNCKDLNT